MWAAPLPPPLQLLVQILVGEAEFVHGENSEREREGDVWREGREAGKMERGSGSDREREIEREREGERQGSIAGPARGSSWSYVGDLHPHCPGAPRRKPAVSHCVWVLLAAVPRQRIPVATRQGHMLLCLERQPPSKAHDHVQDGVEGAPGTALAP